MSSPTSFKSTTIFVGNLSLNTTESKLSQLFGTIGHITSIRSRNSYAYINYNSINDAEKAIKKMNFRFINGKQCRVMWYQKNHNDLKKCGESNIFVKNLDSSVDNKILYDTFAVFGEILSCKVVLNKFTNKSLGYGYIQFANNKSAQNAIKGVNGIKILNKPITAQTFIPKCERIKTQIFTNIYVKFIPQSFDEKTLVDLFEKETGGKITHSSFWRKPFGISACLNFSNPNDAKIAIEKLNKRNINGYQLYVAKAQKKSQRQQFLKKKNQNKRQYKYNNQYRNSYKQPMFTNNKHIQNQQRVNGIHNSNNNNNNNGINNFVMPYIMQPSMNNQIGFGYNGQQSIPIYNMQYMQPQTIYQQPIINNANNINNGNNNISSVKQHSVPMPFTQPQTVYVSQSNFSVPNVSQPIISQPLISQPMVSAPMREKEPLTSEQLSNVNKETSKRMIGERLFSQIQSIEPRLAGKITGMLLELDNNELLTMLDDQKKLCKRINEALDVLKEHHKQKSVSNISNNGSAPN